MEERIQDVNSLEVILFFPVVYNNSRTTFITNGITEIAEELDRDLSAIQLQ